MDRDFRIPILLLVPVIPLWKLAGDIYFSKPLLAAALLMLGGLAAGMSLGWQWHDYVVEERALGKREKSDG